MIAFRHKTLNAVASFAAAFGAFATATPGMAQTASEPAETRHAPSSSAAVPSWQANDDDFLFLQLVIENFKLTYDVRGYQTDRGICLDLADVIQSLDLPIRIDKQSRRATGWLFAEDQQFTLDRAAGTVQNVNTGRAPVSEDIYDTPEGWCVDTDALSQWFGLTFRPDLYNAIVRLESDEDLPFMQAIERRSRAARLRTRPAQFDLSQYPSADMEYRAWRTPSLDVVAQAGVRTGEGSQSGAEGRVELYAAGEAVGASYFARIATDDQLNPQTVRLRAYRNAPEGGLLGPLDATQVAIGDVETIPGRLTGQTAIGRGAFVTNRPLGQSSRFSTTTLRGTLPGGWDAELYRNGQLLAFQDDRGDGRYEFIDVELYFGRNELEVVLYGPQGQIRRDKTSVPIGFNQIEPGETYYWAGILQDNRDLFDLGTGIQLGPQKWRWGVGVERGLDQRTSARLGVQSLYFDGARRRYAEGAVMRSLGAVQLELAAAHEFGAGSVAEANALGRIGRFNFGANALVSFGDFTSEFAEGSIDYRAGFNFDTSLALGKISLPLQADISHTKQKDGSEVNELLMTTSVTAGRFALSAQLSHQQRTASPSTPASTDTRIRLLANSRFKDFRVRGNATFLTSGPDKGLESATVRLDTDFGENAELQGQLDYTARVDEFRLTAGYTRRFEEFSLRGDAFVTSTGGIGASVQLAFSLGPDPVSGGVRVTNNKLARSGQAAVTVFRDDNGNARRDPGEDVLRDVQVEAGLRSTDAITGENGRAIVDDLRPFRPVLVGIDEASLDDPFLAPSNKGVVLTPRPGIVAQIELPISPTGEVEGTILNASGVQQPGVRVELVDNRGAVVAQTLSEFDGFFLFQRVPYGQYRVIISEESATALKVAAPLQMPDGRRVFTLNRHQDVVRFGTIRLIPENSPNAPIESGPVIAAVRPD
ncbi:carboxypeptidase-like regulatory domain-containing protein [Erythrobacter sp. Alg231-14]|uniref:carboxypeptidase-like regulatory domain-containing protein n=1 Tax=Erythrobacter sp. Alg231-14 TaxID=1922225 RepID=UPI000D54CAA8